MASLSKEGAVEGASVQVLSFRLDDEVFALGIEQVREILDQTRLTRVPRMPAFMRGVVNLRGSVLPVVDMRVKFGLDPVKLTVDSCIIVVEIVVDGELTPLGALVDAVEAVLDLQSDDFETPPRVGAKLDTRYIRAMARVPEGFIIILDADAVFSADEIIAIRDVQSRSSETKVPSARAARGKKRGAAE